MIFHTRRAGRAASRWPPFVECLAEGRGVSLPAMAVGLGKGAAPMVAPMRAPGQFKVPIAEFGGVQERWRSWRRTGTSPWPPQN